MTAKKRTKAAEQNRRRQSEFIARQEAAGLKMLRGVWVPKERHDEIKAKLLDFIKTLG